MRRKIESYSELVLEKFVKKLRRLNFRYDRIGRVTTNSI